ncbi:MAG: ATP-binding protein [Leptospirales bacterium]|jgi:DNA replication protein DnaC
MNPAASSEQREIDFTAELARFIQKRDGRAECNLCFDTGILYDRAARRGDPGGYVLCECRKRKTRCEGRPPYEFYDPETRTMLPCPSKPARIALSKLRRLEKKSEIPARYAGKFLNDILIDQADIFLAADLAFDIACNFANGESRGLYLHGGTGSGKTLVSCALLNELMRFHLVPVRYAKISRDILGRLRASFNPNSEFYGEGRRIEQELAGVPALVIDDFGVHKETEWVNQVLYDLIDARYENNLLTVLTSNEPMDSWKEVGSGRVYSRLREICKEVPIEAPDYRIESSLAREPGNAFPAAASSPPPGAGGSTPHSSNF